MKTRIHKAVLAAEEAFWAKIAELFPEAVSGDLGMNMSFRLDMLHHEAVTSWVDQNIPKRVAIEQWTEELHLRDKAIWSMLNTGGGCNVAISGMFIYGPKARYVGVSSTLVAIYSYKDGDDWLAEDGILSTWELGDNPTVLINQMEEYLFGCKLANLNALFDDIMTIAKSDKVS